MKAPRECSRAIQGHSLTVVMTSVRRSTLLLQAVDLPGVTVITQKWRFFKVYPVNFIPYEALSLRYKTFPVLPNNHGLGYLSQ